MLSLNKKNLPKPTPFAATPATRTTSSAMAPRAKPSHVRTTDSGRISTTSADVRKERHSIMAHMISYFSWGLTTPTQKNLLNWFEAV